MIFIEKKISLEINETFSFNSFCFSFRAVWYSNWSSWSFSKWSRHISKKKKRNGNHWIDWIVVVNVDSKLIVFHVVFEEELIHILMFVVTFHFFLIQILNVPIDFVNELTKTSVEFIQLKKSFLKKKKKYFTIIRC